MGGMSLNLDSLGAPQVIIIAIIGLLVLVAGYRIKKIAFFLIWFILGFYLSATLLPYISPVLPHELVYNWPEYRMLLPLAGGLLLAFFGFSFEKLCVAGICFALVILITVQYFGRDIQTVVAGGMIGVLLAGASTMLLKPATILATSAAGAYTITMALLVLVPNINQEIAYFPSLVGLTALGALVQFLTTRHIL